MIDVDATEISLSDGTNEIVFQGYRANPNAAIDEWDFSDLVDWRGQAESKSRPIDRPNTHGSFQPKRVLRSSRAVSFVARFVGTSLTATRAAIDELSAMGAENPVTIKVKESSGTTTRLVTVQGVRALDRRAREDASVAVDLFAADSRRYALSEDVAWVSTGPPAGGLGLVWPAVWPLIWPGGGSSGRITLTNSGTAPSAPEFRLSGGFSSALITSVETGARIGLDRPVPAGSVVSVDTAQHRAEIDGQSDVSRWLRWREWELVPPGESRTYQFDVVDPDGSPMLEGRVLSAWW